MAELVTSNWEQIAELLGLIAIISSLIGLIRTGTRLAVHLKLIEEKVELLKEDLRGFEDESREHRSNIDGRLGRVEKAMWR